MEIKELVDILEKEIKRLESELIVYKRCLELTKNKSVSLSTKELEEQGKIVDTRIKSNSIIPESLNLMDSPFCGKYEVCKHCWSKHCHDTSSCTICKCKGCVANTQDV